MAYRPKHVIEYVLMRGLLGMINLVPRKAALVLVWPFARLSYFFVGRRSREARRRMRAVLGPGASDRDMRRWAWVSWRNLVFNVVEIAQAPGLKPEQLVGTFKVLQLDTCRELTASKKGYTIAVIHMGNWELAGFVVRTIGIPLFVMMRGQKNPLVTAYLDRVREGFGVGAIERHTRALGSIIKRIRSGEVFTILPDIRAKARDSAIVVPYLSGEAYLNGGMALFAKHTETPIFPMIIRRDGWFGHTLIEQPPIYPDPSADKEADMLRMTAEVMAVFDRAVRETPEQYFWYNKRWVLDDRF